MLRYFLLGLSFECIISTLGSISTIFSLFSTVRYNCNNIWATITMFLSSLINLIFELYFKFNIYKRGSSFKLYSLTFSYSSLAFQFKRLTSFLTSFLYSLILCLCFLVELLSFNRRLATDLYSRVRFNQNLVSFNDLHICLFKVSFKSPLITWQLINYLGVSKLKYYSLFENIITYTFSLVNLPSYCYERLLLSSEFTLANASSYLSTPLSSIKIKAKSLILLGLSFFLFTTCVFKLTYSLVLPSPYYIISYYCALSVIVLLGYGFDFLELSDEASGGSSFTSEFWSLTLAFFWLIESTLILFLLYINFIDINRPLELYNLDSWYLGAEYQGALQLDDVIDKGVLPLFGLLLMDLSDDEVDNRSSSFYDKLCLFLSLIITLDEFIHLFYTLHSFSPLYLSLSSNTKLLESTFNSSDQIENIKVALNSSDQSLRLIDKLNLTPKELKKLPLNLKSCLEFGSASELESLDSTRLERFIVIGCVASFMQFLHALFSLALTLVYSSSLAEDDTELASAIEGSWVASSYFCLLGLYLWSCIYLIYPFFISLNSLALTGGTLCYPNLIDSIIYEFSNML